ncbi:hypothetical protein ACH41H_34895 [Streptomyces sp. NPDC020800]
MTRACSAAPSARRCARRAADVAEFAEVLAMVAAGGTAKDGAAARPA